MKLFFFKNRNKCIRNGSNTYNIPLQEGKIKHTRLQWLVEKPCITGLGKSVNWG